MVLTLLSVRETNGGTDDHIWGWVNAKDNVALDECTDAAVTTLKGTTFPFFPVCAQVWGPT
jgi:hypothetical protein